MRCSECGRVMLPDEYYSEEHAPPNPPDIKCIDCSIDDDDDTWEDTRDLG